MGLSRFLLIRHAKTQSNSERRYIGNPEEPLCAEGIRAAEALARSGKLPPVDVLYSGPALRCRQTMEILFPGAEYSLCPLGEVDFGIFKGKNADDLVGNREYEDWLETNCMGDIPGGDSVIEFKNKCCEIFRNIAHNSIEQDVGLTALVMHGGNIMAILERYALPKKDFYEYHIPNCGYILCRCENDALYIENESDNK
jgi:alpha-ribazole phosphatase